MPIVIDVIRELGAIPYDYTKIDKRAEKPDYDLTFSMSENNWPKCLSVLQSGGKVAVVFNLGAKRGKASKVSQDDYPTHFGGFPVVSGDDHDLRFLDSHPSGGGFVVGLYAKEDALGDTTGFVVHSGDSRIPSSEQHKLASPKILPTPARVASDNIKRGVDFSLPAVDAKIEEYTSKVGYKLLTAGAANPKTAKSGKMGYMTVILHLAPANESGIINVCPLASLGCAAACLNTAGVRFQLKNKVTARIVKTWIYARKREWFVKQLTKELRSFVKKANKLGLKPAVRLNGTSDIAWEKINV